MKISKIIQKKKKVFQEPKTYLTINNKIYRAIKPEEAIAIAKALSTGEGIYKVHVIYGREHISKRKTETIENEGKFNTAKAARQAILAFLDQSLWREKEL